MIAGTTNSTDGDICILNGNYDYWVVKLDGSGMLEWQKTYGGTRLDRANGIISTIDGGLVVSGYTFSPDGDVTGHRGLADGWILKLNFTGTPVLPEVSISASDIIICPNQDTRFIATTVNGGPDPFFKWIVNGVNIGINNDTVVLNSLQNGDVIRCELTSSSPCVTARKALSNSIVITVSPSETPTNYLGIDTAICDFETIELKATGSYVTYLWNNNDNTLTLNITQPGEYWLHVLTASGCPGRDTILVSPKDCFKGFFMPTGFTPNGDGKNDVLKPVLGGRVLQYKFTVLNRWGQIVFQSAELGKGWDGTLIGLKQETNVFIWTCTYQFEGEEPKLRKGTAVLLR